MGFSKNLPIERKAGFVAGVAVAVSGGYFGMELGNRIEKFQSLPNSNTLQMVSNRTDQSSIGPAALAFGLAACYVGYLKSLNQIFKDNPLILNIEKSINNSSTERYKKGTFLNTINERQQDLRKQAIGFFAVAGVALVPAALSNLSKSYYNPNVLTEKMASPWAQQVNGVLRSPVFGDAADAGLGVSCFMGVLGLSALAGKCNLNRKKYTEGFVNLETLPGR